MQGSTFVVGALNRDIAVTLKRRPMPGETVFATDVRRTDGGKGANQAAAAARSGSHTVMVGAVGDDEDGVRSRQALAEQGVDVGSIAVLEQVPTGTAYITVTPDGENSIIVVSGANTRIDPSAVTAALAAVTPTDIVVLQSEVPASVLDAAAAEASSRGARVVINDGPVALLASRTLELADPLIVNLHEAHDLLGHADGHGTPSGPDLAAAVRRATTAASVVVTMGAAGSAVADEDGTAEIPPIAVPHVVDTTGAGDTFVGTVAACLAGGDTLLDAVREASTQAASCVLWEGARPPAHIGHEHAPSRL